METAAVPIGSLTPDPDNARTHPAGQVETLKASLQRFGQQKPIVVDADGVIVAGNGTWEAAKALGWETIEIVRTGLSGTEARAYALADNRVPELGGWDVEILAAQLSLPDIGSIGFDAADLERMVAREAAQPPEPPPAAAAPDRRVDGVPAIRGKGVKLTAEQRLGLDEVFARFRQKHEGGGPLLSEGQILVLICMDWMAGN